MKFTFVYVCNRHAQAIKNTIQVERSRDAGTGYCDWCGESGSTRRRPIYELGFADTPKNDQALDGL